PPNAQPFTDPLPDEGIWHPTGRTVQGLPSVYTTFMRPDPVHTSLVTGLAWMDTKLLRTVFVPGLQEPAGGPNPWGSQIPEDQRAGLVSAFNSGFKMDGARGGYYTDGQMVKPLRDGAASLVSSRTAPPTSGCGGATSRWIPGSRRFARTSTSWSTAGRPCPDSTPTRTTSGVRRSATRCSCGGRRSAWTRT